MLPTRSYARILGFWIAPMVGLGALAVAIFLFVRHVMRMQFKARKLSCGPTSASVVNTECGNK